MTIISKRFVTDTTENKSDEHNLVSESHAMPVYEQHKNRHGAKLPGAVLSFNDVKDLCGKVYIAI